MEAIYKNKPIYRQAYILSERCKDLGIKLVYNLLYYVLVIFLTLETISNI